MDDSQADAFFTVDKGIGLSLLRLRIAPEGTTLELASGNLWVDVIWKPGTNGGTH